MMLSLVSYRPPVIIDPNIPVLRWRQVADILRGQIERGELSGKLPGERCLS